MTDVERIVGAEQLISIFSYWPSFHDAEVLWMRLDRLPHVSEYGPTLEVLIYTYEITSEVDTAGYYVLRHHVLVHLRFDEVVELQLEGFNHLNQIWGLELTDISDRQMERVKWEVGFSGSWGVVASFNCYNVAVVSVTPCNKAGEPIA